MGVSFSVMILFFGPMMMVNGFRSLLLIVSLHLEPPSGDSISKTPFKSALREFYGESREGRLKDLFRNSQIT